MIRIISLGAGVQSTTMALMAAHGEIGPMPDCAIFADTQGEPAAVYEHLNWLRSGNVLPFPVHVVTRGNLWESATRVRKRADGAESYIVTGIPVYLEEGLRKGIGKRQCTRDFKVDPVTRKARSLLGLKRVRASDYKRGPLVEMWIGISQDEAARMKPSTQPWIDTRWPLIERKMTRMDCLAWMRDKGYPQPPKSSCTFCPFHDNAAWRKLTAVEFSDCVAKEAQLQRAYASTTKMRGTPFFHAERKPLASVDLSGPDDADTRFSNECEGMCGV